MESVLDLTNNAILSRGNPFLYNILSHTFWRSVFTEYRTFPLAINYGLAPSKSLPWTKFLVFFRCQCKPKRLSVVTKASFDRIIVGHVTFLRHTLSFPSCHQKSNSLRLNLSLGKSRSYLQRDSLMAQRQLITFREDIEFCLT